MNLLKDRVAVITGAASGIGKACAEVFCRRGAKVVLSDLESSNGESVAAGLRDQGYDAIFVACDVSDAEEVENLMDQAVETFGTLHIGVNNAGISGQMEMTGEMSTEAWQQVIDVNLTGAFFCMKAQIEKMLAGEGGSIINVASVAGAVGFATAPAYTASKHGLVGLTRTAALEYSAQGIRVNVIGPGVIKTPMVDDTLADEEASQSLLASHPIGRFGEPEEVANLVAFLAGDDSSFVTGSYYPVDGGYLAH